MALETIYKTVNDNGEYSCGDIGISKEEWFQLLKHPDARPYFDTLCCFLREYNHAATCTEVAQRFGNTAAHYNAKITNFAKWVQKKLNRFQVIATDGSETFWCIPMEKGWNTKEGFKWQLRTELVEALRYYLMKALILRFRESEQFKDFDESYKWELLDRTEGKGVLDIVKSLQDKIQGQQVNLVYNAQFNGVMNYLSKHQPDLLTATGEHLFDESKPIDERIATFKAEMRSNCPSDWKNFANDERTASALLMCKYPEKYTTYKDEVYQHVCRYFGYNIREVGKKFGHFIEIIDGFVADFGEKIQGIIMPHISQYHNKPMNLAVQTVFWCMRDYMKARLANSIRKYWLSGYVFGSEGNQFDRFINEGIWESKHDDDNASDQKMLEISKTISEGDIIILKSTSTKGPNHDLPFMRIKAVGVVTSSISTFHVEGATKCQCTVQYISTESKDFDGSIYGSYRKTIHQADGKVQDVIDYVDSLLNNEPTMIQPEQKYKEYIELLEETHNLVLTGSPGTGKTYMARAIAEEMGAETMFVQFHPSYDYTDFVEGLRPIDMGDDQMGFKRRDGVFKEFCRSACEAPTIEVEISNEEAVQSFKKDLRKQGEITIPSYLGPNSVERTVCLSQNDSISVIGLTEYPYSDEKILKYMSTRKRLGSDTYSQSIGEHILKYYKHKTKLKPFVFIIDEINRGEASKIFGELFFAIDPGYRGKTDLMVQTQYQNLVPESDVFANGFYVPENVYILATMNDIDRSVESMDFAMRRRFTWHEITPGDTESMLDELKCANEAKATMHRLNAAIAETDGLGAAYMIGPAYFLKLKDNGGDFKKLWKMNIQPLLKEYLRGFRKTEEILDKFSKAYFDKQQEATTGHPALDE